MKMQRVTPLMESVLPGPFGEVNLELHAAYFFPVGTVVPSSSGASTRVST